jgi:hypothetical protein
VVLARDLAELEGVGPQTYSTAGSFSPSFTVAGRYRLPVTYSPGRLW